MKNIFILIAYFAFASSGKVQLGTYAAAPVAHDSVAFELLKGGLAIVTEDYFDINGDKNNKPTKVIKGSWDYQDPFLSISFGVYKDVLRKEDCPQLFPCFKFEKSQTKGLSPLNVPYGFGIRSE